MKKLFLPVSCFAVVLILSKASFAQFDDAPGYAHSQSQLSVANIIAQAQVAQHAHPTSHAPMAPHALPFGYPPYPMVDGMPTFGVPYSFPRERRAVRAQRPMFARFAPPPFQPHALPVPGSVPGPWMRPEAPPMVAPPLTFGQVPQQDGMITAVPALAGPPVVVHRPTPLRNFRTLMFAPRPYLGYDPYAGFPPFPGYLPPH